MSNNQNMNLEVRVTNMIHDIGVFSTYKRLSIYQRSYNVGCKNEEVINAVTKSLYPGLASKFTTTPSRVERAIRHAIEVAWNRGQNRYA